MEYEKSCGAVVFAYTDRGLQYVIVTERSGNHSIPKGHMEAGETERETALREIYEETGLEVSLVDGFRETDEYELREKPGVRKQVVYFLAECKSLQIQARDSDVTEAIPCSFREGCHLLEHLSSRRILIKADQWLSTLERIRCAEPSDYDRILQLYKTQVGRKFCAWDDSYPGPEEIEKDLESGNLFILKDKNGRVIASVSQEKDPDVDALSCWDAALQPAAEFARVAVAPDVQGRKIGRIMVSRMIHELRRQGYKSVHFLVNKHNLPAIRCYDAFNCSIVGEVEMYAQPFLCYEKKL